MMNISTGYDIWWRMLSFISNNGEVLLLGMPRTLHRFWQQFISDVLYCGPKSMHNSCPHCLDHIDDMTKRIGDMDDIIKDYMEQYENAINAIDDLPGVARRSAEVIIAEIGKDMERFPSAAHLCSWAGVSPGNHQSAGKRGSGRTTKGNKTLKTILTQCAKVASHSKESFFSAQYQRIAARRGKNRATIAVAHSMLIAIYHVLKTGVVFKDLGSDYYNSFNREHKIKSYLKRLQTLGWEPEPVTISA